MPDSQVVKHSLNLGVVTVTGTLLSMPMEHLVLGLVGGAIHVGFSAPVTRRLGMLSMTTSSLLAGASAQWLSTISPAAPPPMLCALLIGVGWSWMVKNLLPKTRDLADGLIKKWTHTNGGDANG